MIDVTGLLYAIFYVLTALAAIVYYRRRVFSNVGDALIVGILPLASCGFLVWMIWKSLAARTRLADLLDARHRRGRPAADARRRFVLKSSFFQIPREIDPGTVPAAR